MNINITARNFKISRELIELINDKLQKLHKYDSKITNIDIILLKESRAEKIELLVSSKSKKYITKCYSSLFEKTLAKAINNIIIQINKNKR